MRNERGFKIDMNIHTLQQSDLPKSNYRHTVWSLVIGGFFTWVSVYGINQTQVQRYLTVKKRSQAVR